MSPVKLCGTPCDGRIGQGHVSEPRSLGSSEILNLVSYVIAQEAKTKVIEVDVVDPFAVQRARTYLYTDSYDDGTLPCIDCIVAETNVLQHSSDNRMP